VVRASASQIRPRLKREAGWRSASHGGDHKKNRSSHRPNSPHKGKQSAAETAFKPQFVSGRKQEQILFGAGFRQSASERKVQTGEDQVLDFVAQQAGTYEFKCAKVCGMHHRMKGKLIIEE
jgi:uncharacterized cupredoxin-like copper-binding protein